MKKALLIGGVAAAAVFAGAYAFAQMHPHGPGGFGPPFMRGMGPGGPGPGSMGPGMMGMGPGLMHGGAGFAFADAGQLDALKKELAITPAQELAWSKYIATLKDAAAAMKTARESVEPATVRGMTPQDRFAFMSNMREAGQKQFDTVRIAADELLATLDDTQKAKAKEVLPGLAFGPGFMHGANMAGPEH